MTITINEVIRAVSEYYDDDIIEQYWDFENSQPVSHEEAKGKGDTLAYFVCVELYETTEGLEGEVLLTEAAKTIRRAMSDLKDALFGINGLANGEIDLDVASEYELAMDASRQLYGVDNNQ